ncbi:hypothetical protein GQ44DRAFT_63072 [Phaeosphaeriaceae sp. PMI808]|nr:hypothetical protein GQ44DRAFT_63072 [Phaeosphaeriaceae sp. PMI808]
MALTHKAVVMSFLFQTASGTFRHPASQPNFEKRLNLAGTVQTTAVVPNLLMGLARSSNARITQFSQVYPTITDLSWRAFSQLLLFETLVIQCRT